MTEARTPTVRQRRLASELRRYREEAGLTLDDAARVLGCSASKVSRYETCIVVPKIRDVAALAELYGLDSDQTETLLDLARNVRKRGWWDRVGVKGSYAAYIQMESDAEAVYCYSQGLIPGLLQTERYAREVISAALLQTVPPDEIERRVKIRLTRQEILRREETPLELWAVLEEGSLRRMVGGPEVMREQLEHLIEVNSAHNVTVQVLPSNVGAHPSMVGDFSILRLPPNWWEAVYIEIIDGSVWVEGSSETYWYRRIFDWLRAYALDPDASAKVISKIIEGSR